ncbi:hypothetical protein BDN71DRAFT_1433262 [Pleurotus eryngii]|uniref:Uncharacterized protein n=1 Tax=Pleurotus eryngii TaxID=5323 RepID=A0A9P5ZU38_PLEER|nr:hypothetical protein BDN71DRAFT_1433262 [Pleurotus eryngii]
MAYPVFQITPQHLYLSHYSQSAPIDLAFKVLVHARTSSPAPVLPTPMELPKHMHTTDSSFISSTTLPSPFQPTFVMGVKAKIEQSVPNCPPTMDEGDINTTILWDWFVKCENFLRHKNTMPADMVKTVVYRMTGVHAIHWLAANGPLLSEMDWDSYKNHLHALFLPSDWEYITRMAILHMKQDSKPFSDFALDIMG